MAGAGAGAGTGARAEAGAGAGAGVAIVEIANMMNPMAKLCRTTILLAWKRINSGMKSMDVDELIYLEGLIETPQWIEVFGGSKKEDWTGLFGSDSEWTLERERKKCGLSSLFTSTKYPIHITSL